MRKNIKMNAIDFSEFWKGNRLSVIRFDSSEYKRLDFYHLLEVDECGYTGRFIVARITHVLKEHYGLRERCCLVSFKILARNNGGAYV